MKGTDKQILSDQVRRKFIESIDVNDIEVMTDTGWSKIKKSHKTVEYERWVLKTTRHTLECADTHIVFRSNTDNEVLEEAFVKDLQPGDCIATDDGYDVVSEVYNTEESENMYDLELDDENHRFYTNGILSHNSATTRGFILWYIIFHQDKVCAILANKLKLATEQLTQLKDSYVNLPMWLQPGIEEWSKTQIKLANGTRLITAATSPDGIRGFSIDILYLDEFAFIDDHIMDDFVASVFPVVSSGKTTKIIITSTPNGLNGFYDMWRKAENKESEFIPKQIMWNAVPGRD